MDVSSQENYQRRNVQQATPEAQRSAFRTAFVARFIVLREGRRSRAHRKIELMAWNDTTTAEELGQKFRDAYLENGDKMQPIDRDIKRALNHAKRSVDYFIHQYVQRSTLSFREALLDYDRSNKLLFGDHGEEVPRSGGWRIPEAE